MRLKVEVKSPLSVLCLGKGEEARRSDYFIIFFCLYSNLESSAENVTLHVYAFADCESRV